MFSLLVNIERCIHSTCSWTFIKLAVFLNISSCAEFQCIWWLWLDHIIYSIAKIINRAPHIYSSKSSQMVIQYFLHNFNIYMCAAYTLAKSWEYSSRIKIPSPCKQRSSVVHGVGRTQLLCLACSELHIFNKQHLYYIACSSDFIFELRVIFVFNILDKIK